MAAGRESVFEHASLFFYDRLRTRRTKNALLIAPGFRQVFLKVCKSDIELYKLVCEIQVEVLWESAMSKARAVDRLNSLR